jgi:hypothetical protein
MELREAVKKFQEFFDIDGLVHHEFTPPGQSVTGHFSVQVLQRLSYAVRGSRATSGRQGQWLLRHDNAPSHTSLVVQQFLPEKSILGITQSLYSLDLGSSDFWLLLILKVCHMGTCFATMKGMISNATAELRRIP